MKVLATGQRSFWDGSPWIPGEWREQGDAQEGGDLCREGLHSVLGDNPLVAPMISFPCGVWEDECEGECARDERTARYRRQRIVREITADFPVIIKINGILNPLIAAIKNIPWMRPRVNRDGCAAHAPYMRVMPFPDAWAAQKFARTNDLGRDPAWDDLTSTAGDWPDCELVFRANGMGCRWLASMSAAKAASEHAGINGIWADLCNAISIVVSHTDGTFPIHSICAIGRVCSILTKNLGNDATWLDRWWEACEMGFYPAGEDGDQLIVGWVKEPE